MLYLFASCIALLIGPLFYRYFSSGSGLQKGLDGFIFVSLGGLVLVHILPELLHHGGFLSLLFVVLGLWGPTASERLFHRYSEITHNLTLALGIGGLLLHTLTDGGAMVLAQQEGNSPLLALGVILHRLPVGLAIWWLLKPQVGTKWASLVIAAMMVLTSVGYFASAQLLSQLSIDNTVYLQAFVTGSILHVVLHQPHGQHDPDRQGKFEYQAGIGSLLGIGLLALLLLLDSGGHHHHSGHEHSIDQLLSWTTQVAPALLLAYMLAATRFSFGLTPTTDKLPLLWLQRLAGPEALLVTLLLLGPEFMLAQLLGLLVIGACLTLFKVQPTDPHPTGNQSALQFGFSQLVDRSAPWVVLSLVLANLIGHPSVPLDHPLMQVLILMLVFLPTRFCNLGGVVLAVSLAWSGWSDSAVMLALLAAPILNWSQLKLMSLKQSAVLVAIVGGLLLIAHQIFLVKESLIAFPESLQWLALALLALIFGASLMRLGPRKFLRRLMITKPLVHSHQHGHDHHHH
ncbi:metal transporter [Shewanella corallii]|uniref:Metal transporter n=1 Tax=Shewanella corallii TaxID=560080 RepID=A0ABT0NCD4_9GAMM|nr:metal transporter [Shewanella corallii]MCL2916101.1 metal transporter [Shewanella corallii]